MNRVIFDKKSQIYLVLKNEYDQKMFEWISFRGNYADHIKTVLRLAQLLLNCIIINRRSQLYLDLKNEYDQKMFDWISCREHYAVHIKTVLRLAEVSLNCVIFNKKSQLYLVLVLSLAYDTEACGCAE